MQGTCKGAYEFVMESIGIIGGADGPTAAFVATSAVAKAGMAVVAVIVVLCVIAAVIFIRKNKNK